MRFFPSLFITGLLLLLLPAQPTCAAEPFKVLVVFSYEQEFPWDVAVLQGIEEAFARQVELHYFYLNTKTDLPSGARKAAEAFALYQRLQPDGVIAVDDNAQAMFVVPYLLNRVTTPVMFCGVNAEPGVYGYPAKNVSGILEHFHLEETLAFSRQLVPQIKTFAFLIFQSPVAQLIQTQLENNADKRSARLVSFHQVRTAAQAIQVAEELRGQVDLLFIESLQGVVDNSARQVNEKSLVAQVVSTFAGPTAATNAYTVKYGALSAVIKSGEEQGIVAANMLLQAMQGVPLEKLPMTRNYRGKRMINVTTLRQLRLKPPAVVLRGAELVRTE